MFIFGTLDERFATPALEQLTRTEKGEVKEIAVWLLMSQATPDALRALHRVDLNGLSPKTVASIRALQRKPHLIVPRKLPKTTRAEFLGAFNALLAGDAHPFDRLVISVPDGERDLAAVATKADLETLRRVRRHFIARNTQHAIEYYNQFTQIIMALVWSAVQLAGKKHQRSEPASRDGTDPVDHLPSERQNDGGDDDRVTENDSRRASAHVPRKRPDLSIQSGCCRGSPLRGCARTWSSGRKPRSARMNVRETDLLSPRSPGRTRFV